MSYLILVRHGQSVWNLEKKFTGWVDVDLTENGKLEAKKAGDLIKMDLPSQNPIICDIPKLLKDGLGLRPEVCYFNEDYIAVFKNEKPTAKPEFILLSKEVFPIPTPLISKSVAIPLFKA